MPRTPGPPGIISAVPLTSNLIGQLPSVNSSVQLRNFVPAAPVLSKPPIQHETITPYASPSPRAAPPGPWLQSQQISGFVRSPYSPYAAVIPDPYPTPNCAMPPLSVPLPDVQPPGVFPTVSSVGVPSSSVVPGGNSIVGSLQAEFPPGIGDRFAQPKDFNFDLKSYQDQDVRSKASIAGLKLK